MTELKSTPVLGFNVRFGFDQGFDNVRVTIAASMVQRGVGNTNDEVVPITVAPKCVRVDCAQRLPLKKPHIFGLLARLGSTIMWS